MKVLSPGSSWKPRHLKCPRESPPRTTLDDEARLTFTIPFFICNSCNVTVHVLLRNRRQILFQSFGEKSVRIAQMSGIPMDWAMICSISDREKHMERLL